MAAAAAPIRPGRKPRAQSNLKILPFRRDEELEAFDPMKSAGWWPRGPEWNYLRKPGRLMCIEQLWFLEYIAEQCWVRKSRADQFKSITSKITDKQWAKILYCSVRMVQRIKFDALERGLIDVRTSGQTWQYMLTPERWKNAPPAKPMEFGEFDEDEEDQEDNDGSLDKKPVKSAQLKGEQEENPECRIWHSEPIKGRKALNTFHAEVPEPVQHTEVFYPAGVELVMRQQDDLLQIGVRVSKPMTKPSKAPPIFEQLKLTEEGEAKRKAPGKPKPTKKPPAADESRNGDKSLARTDPERETLWNAFCSVFDAGGRPVSVALASDCRAEFFKYPLEVQRRILIDACTRFDTIWREPHFTKPPLTYLCSKVWDTEPIKPRSLSASNSKSSRDRERDEMFDRIIAEARERDRASGRTKS